MCQAVVPGIEALRGLVGFGWQSAWARRCGKLFRDLPGNIGVSADYTAAMQALVQRGLGQYVADKGLFIKQRYVDLGDTARAFLKEAGVPAWTFRLQECSQVAFQRPLAQRNTRSYKNILFDGTPLNKINNSKELCATVRRIVGESAAGATYLRLREQRRKGSRTLAGTCDQRTCEGCSWKLLATLTLTPQGQNHLVVKTDGVHGARVPMPGRRLWTESERQVLAKHYPAGVSLTAAGVRKAFAANNMVLSCSEKQLKQFISRENRKRRGAPKQQRPTVQEMVDRVARWQADQPSTFATSKLAQIRIVGEVIINVGRAFFAWSCRGFLNHLRGHLNGPLCLVVDGKQKIAKSGAVIATIGILATSTLPRNTSIHDGGNRVQLQLKTSNVLPLMQAYMEGETMDNFVTLFRTLCAIVQEEFKMDLVPKVLQVQADFSDSIEAARRKVFTYSRPAKDYPHMMRAAQSTLGKKTTPFWRQRVLNVLRATRHLPTVEIFSAVWTTFFQELETQELHDVAAYLKKEYLHLEKQETLNKMYNLRGSSEAETKLWWAAYWAVTLGIHPGSATGTQSLEAFYSFWQRQISSRARAAPSEILNIMQQLYDGPWSEWMCADDCALAAG